MNMMRFHDRDPDKCFAKSFSQSGPCRGIAKSLIPVTMVCGPPGSGKSTWITKEAFPSDLLIDLDEIIAKLSGKPIYQAGKEWLGPAIFKRDEILRSLGSHPRTGYPAAWFINQAPFQQHRVRWAETLGAKIVVIETPPGVCIDRIKNDARRNDKMSTWEVLVWRWWKMYSSHPTDTVIRGG